MLYFGPLWLFSTKFDIPPPVRGYRTGHFQRRSDRSNMKEILSKYVYGVTTYNPFREYLKASKGVYRILNRRGNVKYIGSSNNIHKRVQSHEQSGLLVRGDRVIAIIFHNNTKQQVILDYEQEQIKKFGPKKNIHTGTPGRPWDLESRLKLKRFYQNNKVGISPEGRQILQNFLYDKPVPSKHQKVTQIFLRIMRFFK